MINTFTPYKITSTLIIHTKNEFHLGDCIFCCIFFYNIKTYIEKNNITIYFYCLSENIEQIKEFNCSKNIIMLPITEIPTNTKIIDLWIGCKEYEYNWFLFDNIPYDVFLCKFYNQILKILNIPVEIESFIYEDNDLLNRLENINKKTNNKYNNIDFLIVNGQPRSGQFEYNLEEWNNFIILLNKKYNVVTTQKVEGVKCTRDDNLTAKDFASISTNHIKTIIAIDSGLAAGLYNKYAIENTDIIYYLCNQNQFCHLSFPNVIKKSSLKELFFLLKDENNKEPFELIEKSKLNINIVYASVIIGLLLFTIVKYKQISNYKLLH